MKKAAPWRGLFLDVFRQHSPGVTPSGKSLQFAARRLSADDLPERRSATIS
jgi:hypothetical protein